MSAVLAKCPVACASKKVFGILGQLVKTKIISRNEHNILFLNCLANGYKEFQPNGLAVAEYFLRLEVPKMTKRQSMQVLWPLLVLTTSTFVESLEVKARCEQYAKKKKRIRRGDGIVYDRVCKRLDRGILSGVFREIFQQFSRIVN